VVTSEGFLVVLVFVSLGIQKNPDEGEFVALRRDLLSEIIGRAAIDSHQTETRRNA
jgi:hypothetical protein